MSIAVNPGAVNPGAGSLRGGVRWLAAVVALAACCLSAMPAMAATKAFLTVAEYRDMARSAAAGHLGMHQALTLYATGLLNAAHTLNETARQVGATPSVCLSPRVQPAALLQAIDAELKARPSFWQEKNDEDAGFAALVAMKQKWPCK